ncbi:hypothetical protein Btru_048527 [Bulinus truncatus]|nr:hypothetical protein Btru_048527 [Bulinus truncatus]
MHKYPLSDKQSCDKWIRANPRKNFVPTIYSRVCSLHFHESDFICDSTDSNLRRVIRKRKRGNYVIVKHLKPEAVSTIFPNAPKYLTTPTTRRSTTLSSSEQRRQSVNCRLEQLFERNQQEENIEKEDLHQILDKMSKETLPSGYFMNMVDNNLIIYKIDINSSSPAISKIYVSTFIFFIIPMSLIALLYFFIALAIRRSTLIRAGSNSSNDCSHTHSSSDLRQNSTSHQHARIRQSVLKMLVAVVVAFFLCWAPFHTQRLMAVYDGSPTLNIEAHNALLYVSGVTYYLSATVNPVLYRIFLFTYNVFFFFLCNFQHHVPEVPPSVPDNSFLLLCVGANEAQEARHRNSYTFKFHHRAANANTHCSVVESSSSGHNNNTNNNVSNNNKQVVNHVNLTTTPVLCCVIGNEAVATTQLEGRPLVVAGDSPGRQSYESNCLVGPPNLPTML